MGQPKKKDTKKAVCCFGTKLLLSLGSKLASVNSRHVENCAGIFNLLTQWCDGGQNPQRDLKVNRLANHPA